MFCQIFKLLPIFKFVAMFNVLPNIKALLIFKFVAMFNLLPNIQAFANI